MSLGSVLTVSSVILWMVILLFPLSLFGPHEYLFDTVEFNAPHFCANCDQRVIPAYINAPNCSLLTRLNNVDWFAAIQIEDNYRSFVVASDEMGATFGESH